MAYTPSELSASRHAAHESLNSEYFVMFWARFLVYMDQENFWTSIFINSSIIEVKNLKSVGKHKFDLTMSDF